MTAVMVPAVRSVFHRRQCSGYSLGEISSVSLRGIQFELRVVTNNMQLALCSGTGSAVVHVHLTLWILTKVKLSSVQTSVLSTEIFYGIKTLLLELTKTTELGLG